jgi:hypothetical protein
MANVDISRRYVALIGGGFIMLGMIVCSTAHTMNVFIGGMTLAGIGAGISEREYLDMDSVPELPIYFQFKELSLISSQSLLWLQPANWLLPRNAVNMLPYLSSPFCPSALAFSGAN